jgi:nitroreductase
MRPADFATLVRSRRTTKEFLPEPMPRELLEQVLELARWAPNHRLTNPWRFRVIGPNALARLKDVAGAGADKLDRAPTLVVVSAVRSPLPLHGEEDVQASAVAAYIALLAAHAHGWAGYWRTPGVLRNPDGRAAVGVPDDEQFLGLLHFGRPAEQPEAPGRSEPDSYITWLD